MKYSLIYALVTVCLCGAGLATNRANAGEAEKPAAPAQATPAAAVKPNSSTVGAEGFVTEVSPEGATGITLDPKQSEAIKKVGDYFNALSTLKGTFVQIGADQKKMKGKFFMQRPGKFRFDYSSPSKQVIISDGQYLAIQDLDLLNEDRIAIDDTPFRMLLRKDVDLVRDARIIEIQEADDLIVLGLQDKSPDTPGRIKLFLAKQPQLELKEWETVDAQGLATRVQVADLSKGAEIDAGLFEIKPVEFMKKDP
jgi:outer membrane lipoprotein-sorting protein